MNVFTAALMLAAEEEQFRQFLEDQHTAGLAPSNAVRPLHDHELRAQTRFADLETDRDAAVGEAEILLQGLHDTAGGAFLQEMFGDDVTELPPEQAIQLIHELSNHMPPAMATAEASVLLPLAGILAATYTLSGSRVIEEAARQGLPAPLIQQAVPPELPAEEFLPSARAVSTHPWRRISTKLEEEFTSQQRALQDTITRDEVAQVLDTIKIDGSRDHARQAVNQASGRGRLDVIDENDALEPDEIWASEIMDGNACNSCVDVDGKDYESLEEATADYPNGQYRNCRGGARCRGTLVFVFYQD